MIEGQELVGQTTVELLDRIEGKYGDDARIGTVVVVVEVDQRDDPDSEEGTNHIEIYASDWRRWVVHGLLSVAAHAQLDGLEGED